MLRTIFFFAMAMVLSVLGSHPVAAQSVESGWQISQFTSNIDVRSSGLVEVHERIGVDFGSLAKHGIYRDIPYQYVGPSGQQSYINVVVSGVQQDGGRATYVISRGNGYKRIKIGKPSAVISGVHTYDITYTVKGALQPLSNYDELYWNATGNLWPVPIERAEATVHLPQAGVVQYSCYQGLSGDTNSCLVRQAEKDMVSFAADQPLPAQAGLTVAVGYSKGMVPILVGTAPTLRESIQEWLSVYWPGVAALAIVGLVGLAGVWQLWYRRGRDAWWSQPQLLADNQLVSIQPLRAKDTIVVEFTPPDSLPPGLMGVLKDERADTLDVTSSLVDLACRGFLTITEVPKQGLLGSADYTFTKLSQPGEVLLPYEKMLLQRLFTTGDSVKLSSLKNSFYQDLDAVKKQLYQDAMDKQLFQENPAQTQGMYLGIGIALAMGGAIIGFKVIESFPIVAGALLGVGIAGVGLIVASQFMSRRTAVGHELYRRSKGYQLFISTAEKHRQQFFEKENLFNQVLPYAMMFGLTHKFAEAMKVIGFTPPAPVWYFGPSPFNLSAFDSQMQTMSQSFASTMASAPSGSGSGGGGFSGGGFGGGGGGSW